MFSTSRASHLLEIIRDQHLRSLPGVLEARAVDPPRFDRYAELFLGWAANAFGEESLPRMVDAFVRFTTDVNFAQARYEVAGHYQHKSYQECHDTVYAVEDAMDEYLLGVYLTNFMWAHHMDLSAFYEDRFLPLLAPGTVLREIAPGHGGWGLWALHAIEDSTLEAYDISPSSLNIAQPLARAAGMNQRASYILKNALEIPPELPGADACICCFLVEHLEDPDALMESMHRLLRPQGLAFFTGALTAAQTDHIYEFRFESELVQLAERHGFRVLEMRSVGPSRTLPRAQFLPRSAAFVLQKRINAWR